MKTAAIRKQTHDDGTVSLHACVGDVAEVTTEGDDVPRLLAAIEARAAELEQRAYALRSVAWVAARYEAAKKIEVQPRARRGRRAPRSPSRTPSTRPWCGCSRPIDRITATG